MLKTLTDRVKPIDPIRANDIPSRYSWLPLQLSEPNLGAPLTTDYYVLTSTNTGERGWAPYDNEIIPILISVDFDALPGENYLVDTTNNIVTSRLPASPKLGNVIYFQDIFYKWDINNLIINRNNSMIQGLEENFICDLKGVYFTMTYVGFDVGWRIS
jgi:hypothetical protein